MVIDSIPSFKTLNDAKEIIGRLLEQCNYMERELDRFRERNAMLEADIQRMRYEYFEGVERILGIIKKQKE